MRRDRAAPSTASTPSWASTPATRRAPANPRVRAVLRELDAARLEAREAKRRHAAVIAASRAATARLRDALARVREALPLVRRARHVEARELARPGARHPRAERPRCGARCRDGHPCTAPVVWNAGDAEPRRRCRMHGGLSTGPQTAGGRARALANLRQGPPRAPPREHLEAVVRQGDALRFPAVETCDACGTASRRCRGAAAWLVRRSRARGYTSREDFERAVRWTRCEAHARAVLGAWAGGTFTLGFAIPCA